MATRAVEPQLAKLREPLLMAYAAARDAGVCPESSPSTLLPSWPAALFVLAFLRGAASSASFAAASSVPAAAFTGRPPPRHCN